MSNHISRRSFLIHAGTATTGLLTGCTSDSLMQSGLDSITTSSIGTSSQRVLRPAIGVDANISGAATMYGPHQDGAHLIPAVPYKKIEARFIRQRVINRTGMPKGSIVIDPHAHYAYYILSQDEAVRYGVSVGKAGFEWSGDAIIGRKALWPRWTPPREMIERSPHLAQYTHGMPGGPQNPLGARALYLFSNGRDTLYRLHGTPEWHSIGRSMSSGCIRFLNQDIIDLFNRVPIGTRVRVL